MKNKAISTLYIFLALILLVGCSGDFLFAKGREKTYEIPNPEDYQEIFMTPWPDGLKESLAFEGGVPTKNKPYTLMIYLNGSDLESDGGAASADIQEMLDSGFDPNKVNVVIYAGGTLYWDSSAVGWVKDDPGTFPDGTSAIYTIVKEDDENKLKTINYDISETNGDKPLAMMDAGTMAGFIDYTKTQFPGDNYSFLFWNHGSGSLVGYGYDELLYEEDPRITMNLLTINKGFAEGKTAFDFIGFDTCLMSNLETALALKEGAKTMIASQELEPSYGWDYAWLKDLSDDPTQDSQNLGKKIVDHFNNFYKENITAIGSSLSVVDLSKTQEVVNALDVLAAASSADLDKGAFTSLANARNKTETFGSSDVKSDRYQYMVDIRDMGKELENLYPTEVQGLDNALDQGVVYSKTTDFNSDKERENVGGLSVYYPYAYGDEQEQALFDAMKSLGISESYHNYLTDYSNKYYGGFGSEETEVLLGKMVANAEIQETDTGDVFLQLSKDELSTVQDLYFNVWQAVNEVGMEDYYFAYLEESHVAVDESGKIITEFNGVLPYLGNDYLCLYEFERTEEQILYTSPAQLNGEEVNLLIAINDRYPEGQILGAQPVTNEKNGVPSRKVKKIKKGDELILEYYAEYLGDDSEKESIWYEGEPFKVGHKLELEWVDVPPNEVFMYGYCIVDVYHNSYYTDFIEIEFQE